MNQGTPHYARETRSAMFQGRLITVTHLTPILSPEQRTRRKREIESQLYGVFSKYRGAKKQEPRG